MFFPSPGIATHRSTLLLLLLVLPQWITTLTSSFTCLPATWTSALTSTPSLDTSSTWCRTLEQVPNSPVDNLKLCQNRFITPPLLRSTGLAVNGQLIGAKKSLKNKLRTYFGVVTVYSQPDGISVTVGTSGVAVADGRTNHSFSWSASSDFSQDR